MITEDYLEGLRKMKIYAIISEGIKNGELSKILRGESPYSLASQNDPTSQIASLLLVVIHSLKKEGNAISDLAFTDALRKMIANDKYLPLALDYIDSYLTYRKENSEIYIDHIAVINELNAEKRINSVTKNIPGVSFLVNEINNKESKNKIISFAE